MLRRSLRFRAAFPRWLAPFAGISGLCRPQHTARRLALLSLGWLIYALLTHVAAIAVIVVSLGLFNGTIDRQYNFNRPTTQPATFPAPTVTVVHRSFGEVWADWGADGGLIHPAWIILAVAAFNAAIVLTAVLWAMLPLAHVRGQIGRAVRRAAASLTVNLPILIAAAAICAALLIRFHHIELISDDYPHWRGVAVYLALLTSLVLFAHRLSTTTAALALRAAPLTLPPRCDGCGYDLTAQPIDGRCPECGHAVVESIGGFSPRIGQPADDARRPLGIPRYLKAAATVLFHPMEFYHRLHLHDPPTRRNAQRYAWMSYVSFGLPGAIVVTMWIALFDTGRWNYWNNDEIVMATSTFALLGPLVVWCMNRAVAALAGTWLWFRGVLPDFRWFAKISYYESVVGWCYVIWTGLMIWSFYEWQDWISQAFQDRTGRTPLVLGMPPEIFAFFGGNLLGMVYAFWRYLRIANLIRWANF